MNFAHLFASLKPAAACGIAIMCCVAGVFGAQIAVRNWRLADDAAPRPDDREFVKAHARAAVGRAAAKAEAAQLASTAFLGTSACIALYAIVPGLPAEAVGALAIVGCTYLVVDAVLSCIAEMKSVDDDEALDIFQERAPEGPGPISWRDFENSHPKAARRIFKRRPLAPEIVGEARLRGQ